MALRLVASRASRRGASNGTLSTDRLSPRLSEYRASPLVQAATVDPRVGEGPRPAHSQEPLPCSRYDSRVSSLPKPNAIVTRPHTHSHTPPRNALGGTSETQRRDNTIPPASFPSLPSTTQLLKGTFIRTFGLNNTCRAFSAEAGVNAVTEGVSVPQAHLQVARCLAHQEAPQVDLVRGMLEQCQSEEDIHKAFNLLARIRLENATKRKQLTDFKEGVTDQVVKACIRCGSYDKAVLALNPRNPYGLPFSATAAVALLRHAKDLDNAPVILNAMRKIQAARGKPSPLMADLALSGLAASGSMSPAVAIALDLQSKGVPLSMRTVHNLLMGAVSNALMAESNDLLDFVKRVKERAMTDDPKAAPDLAAGTAAVFLLSGDVESAANTFARALDANPEAQNYLLTDALPSVLQKLSNTVKTKEAAEGLPQGAKDALAKVIQSIPKFVEELKSRGIEVPADTQNLFMAHE